MGHILWVDDRASTEVGKQLGFDALMWFVKERGHDLTVAASVSEIEREIERVERYGLVVLDILMEPLSGSTTPESRYGGLDVLERLAARGGMVIPVIVLSVIPPAVVRREAEHRRVNLKAAGVHEIIEKGRLRPSKIADAIERVMAVRGAGSEGPGA